LLGDQDLDVLLKEILVTAISVTRADMGHLLLFDPEKRALRIRVAQGFDSTYLTRFEEDPAVRQAVYGATLLAGKRVVVQDVGAPDQDLEPESRRMHED